MENISFDKHWLAKSVNERFKEQKRSTTRLTSDIREIIHNIYVESNVVFGRAYG